jgi:hypothetical protein
MKMPKVDVIVHNPTAIAYAAEHACGGKQLRPIFEIRPKPKQPKQKHNFRPGA